MATYTYLPWVRQGLIGAVAAGTVNAGRIEIKVHANVPGETVEMAEKNVSVLLFGPGDVTGFDARQVIRTDPPHLTSGFETNYFPLIEFDRPDFPWLFTPAEPNSQNQLKPWICLIAVEKREGVEIKFQEGQPLPVLTIPQDAYKDLPDLSESWAWAHAQISTDAEVQTALESQPERTLARLMCPRHLKEKTAYYACVVPTYMGGVQAGLGEPVPDATALEPGWTLGINPLSPSTIRLPVYYHWEFATGAQGDFESLVWQLERRQLSFAEVGTRKLDISHADYGLPAGDPVDLEGVLGPQAQPGDEPIVGPSTDYQQRLQVLLNETAVPPLPVLPPPMYGRWSAAQRAIPDTISPGVTRDRAWLRAINLDPRYRVAAGLGAQIVRDQQEQLMASAWDQVGDIERANQILRQAQLARAASISIHQERFGKLDATTFLLTTGAVHPRVRNSSTQTARGVVQASNLPRAATSTQFRRMLRQRGAIAERFGIASLTNRINLIARLNQGQIHASPRRWPTPDGMATMESVLHRSLCNVTPQTLAQALIDTWPPEKLIPIIEQTLTAFRNGDTDMATFANTRRQQLEQAAKNLSHAQDQLASYPAEVSRAGTADFKLMVSLYRPAMAAIAEARWIFNTVARGFRSNPPNVINAMDRAMRALPTADKMRDILFRLAAIMHLQMVEPCDDKLPPQKPALDINKFKLRVQKKLDPNVTIAARVGMLIQAPGWKPDDLDFVLASPDFPAPMYKELAKLSQEWMLPGLQHIPPNTLTLLESNNPFIEAFMVGLNHEMSRELLWRGYPTDQRGTYFRQFWDPSGRFPASTTEDERKDNLEKGKDIPPIHEWGDENLGGSFGKQRVKPGTSAPLRTIARIVLLIRGDLLRRYPRAMIYAAKAEWSKDGAGNKQLPRNPTSAEKYPIFRGELAPDINFLGFDLGLDEAQGMDQPSNNANYDGAGWFIVIEQQPTEPRYGLDETAATSPIKGWTWRDLAWPHVNLPVTNGYIKLLDGVKTTFPSDGNQKPGKWNWSATTDSAQLACITLQGPVRVAIHASDLL